MPRGQRGPNGRFASSSLVKKTRCTDPCRGVHPRLRRLPGRFRRWCADALEEAPPPAGGSCRRGVAPTAGFCVARPADACAQAPACACMRTRRPPRSGWRGGVGSGGTAPPNPSAAAARPRRFCFAWDDGTAACARFPHISHGWRGPAARPPSPHPVPKVRGGGRRSPGAYVARREHRRGRNAQRRHPASSAGRAGLDGRPPLRRAQGWGRPRLLCGRGPPADRARGGRGKSRAARDSVSTPPWAVQQAPPCHSWLLGRHDVA